MHILQRFLLPKVFKFARDERGAVLIYISLMLPLFVGLSLLAVDASRVYNLTTQLQKAADALALAGAAELDRRPDAITRANAAMTNLVANEQKFAAGAARISFTDLTIRFLRSLPADDTLPITSANEVTGATTAERSANARFVEVVVNPRTLTTILPAGFISGATTVSPSATAVAGFTSVVCKTTPMFICNPFEGTGTSIFDPAARGRQIKMQVGGGTGAQYFPGNYGWLDSPTYGNGANALRDALAQVRPPACFEQTGVTLQTGNIESANKAINVRFDMFEGPYNGDRNNSNYVPAPNVRKGYAPGSGGGPSACNLTGDATTATYRMGPDGAFPDASGRLGNGAWDFDTYWNKNYGGPPLNLSPPNSWSNATNRPSRYQVYRYELSTMSGGGTNLVNHQSLINEVGNPTCYNGSAPANDPDRRLLYAAIINCSELNVHGGSGGPVGVLAFGKFFMTEPIPSPPATDAGTIYSEFVDVIRPGVDNEVARDKVQLYR